MFNQLRFTYVRQFGGRVNNPTTSLGDLNSRFAIQGDPTLPRITVSGYFTGSDIDRRADAGSDYFSVKDSCRMTRGNHSFKFGGELSYEKIVHDTLLDNYGVFASTAARRATRYADFLLGLPATMTQDAPIRKTGQRRLVSLFAQDDCRVHPRVTLNLGVRYDLQFPLPIPQNRKLASCRARSPGVADRAGGPPLPGRPGHQPAASSRRT